MATHKPVPIPVAPHMLVIASELLRDLHRAVNETVNDLPDNKASKWCIDNGHEARQALINKLVIRPAVDEYAAIYDAVRRFPPEERTENLLKFLGDKPGTVNLMLPLAMLGGMFLHAYLEEEPSHPEWPTKPAHLSKPSVA